MGLTSINVNNIDTNLRPTAGAADFAVTVADTSGGILMVSHADVYGTITDFSKWFLESGTAAYIAPNLTIDKDSTSVAAIRSVGLGLKVGAFNTVKLTIGATLGEADSGPTTVVLMNGGVAIGEAVDINYGSTDLTTYVFIPTEPEVTINFTTGGGGNDDIVTLVSIAVESSILAASTTHVFWTLDTADARFTLDGSAPTDTNGHLADGTKGVKSGIWHRSMAEGAKWIRTGANSAVLHVSQLTQ